MSRIYKLIIDDEDYEDVMVEEDDFTCQLLDSIDALADTYTRIESSLNDIYDMLDSIYDFIPMKPEDDSKIHCRTNDSNNVVSADDFNDDYDLDNSDILF